MFIGKNPGKPLPPNIGLPFVGSQSGDLFHDMLNKVQFKFDEVYTTNITKCSYNDGFRNLEPTFLEVANCQEYLANEIRTISPKIIVCIGKFASKYLPKALLEVKKSKVFHIWHPAYPLRSFKVEEYHEQFKKIKKYYNEIAKKNTNLKITDFIKKC